MKTTEEIAGKFSTAGADLISAHAREIERIRDDAGGKINLRFACLISKGSLKTRLSFGLTTKDEVDERLDGDQLPLNGLQEPLKVRRKKNGG